ncbi:MAG TPA: c-type cytochrome [Burkholderiales bacterium]|jgi:mono/diheme cytochrome c family protein
MRTLPAALALGLSALAASPAQAQPDAASAQGARVYANNCAACHQAGGTGVPGAFPPLAGHVPGLLKTADGRSYVEKVLLFGLEGKISVNGNSFAGTMPPWQSLSDADIAAVLNYVSNNWDNAKALPAGFKPFGADEIKALRTPPLTSAAVYAQRPGGSPPAAGSGGGQAAASAIPVSITAGQVARGAEIYARRCADCHGSSLDNGEFGGAPLNGSYFKQHWGAGSVAALIAFAKAKMPPDRPGSLTDQNYADVIAFLLDANDYPKGDKELPPDPASQQAMSLKR